MTLLLSGIRFYLSMRDFLLICKLLYIIYSHTVRFVTNHFLYFANLILKLIEGYKI